MTLPGRRLRTGASHGSRGRSSPGAVDGWPRDIQVTYAWAPFRDGLWDRIWDTDEFPQITLRASHNEFLRSFCDRALGVFAEADEWDDPRLAGEYFVSFLALSQHAAIDLGSPDWIEPLYGVRTDGSLFIEGRSLSSITLGDVHRGIQAGYMPGSIDRVVIKYPQGLGGGLLETTDQLIQFLDNLGVLVTTAAGGNWVWTRRHGPKRHWNDRQARRTARAWREGKIQTPFDLRQWIDLKGQWEASEVATRLSIPNSTADALLEALGYEYDRRSGKWTMSTSAAARDKRNHWLDGESRLRMHEPQTEIDDSGE